MNITLYPPLVESKLKAFTTTGEGEGILEIPFQHNPAVNRSLCKYMVARIRTLAGVDVADGKLLYGTIVNTENASQSIARFSWKMPMTQEDFVTPQIPSKSTLLLEKSDKKMPLHMFTMNSFKTEQFEDSRTDPDGRPSGLFDQKYDNDLEEFFQTVDVELSPSSYGMKDTENWLHPNLTVNRLLGASDDMAITEASSEDTIWQPEVIDNGQVIANLTVGFYRIQLAYFIPSVNQTIANNFSRENQYGYYSDVAIIKYTSQPRVYLEGLQEDKINIMNTRFDGVVEFTDLDDYIYSYQYLIYTNDYNASFGEYELEYDTGEILYNNKYNTPDDSKLICKTSFSYDKDLPKNRKYYIELIINTITGLTVHSPRYMIKNGYAISLKLPASTKLIAEVNADSAYVTVRLTSDAQGYFSGKFEILRTNHYSKFKTWEKIYSFELSAEKINDRLICNDYTIQQGVRYQYALRQYNDHGIISNKLKTSIVTVDYEDMYLSDADHLLQIRFNPQMQTFKPDILESKLETIGSRYPYIFRNGIVNYKEFSISGLISYLMDSVHKFIPYEDSIYSLLDESTRTSTESTTRPPNEFITNKSTNNFVLTDLTGTNILYEKDFKLKVLDWLTNGKPKLLRSPTEGSYIVRLMNVSLSPQQPLGRMLHTFSSTAYEIDELTMENLIKYNLIKTHRTDRPELPEMLFRGYEFGHHPEIDIPLMSTIIAPDGLSYNVPSTEELLAEMQDKTDGKKFINGYETRIPQLLYKVAFYDCIPGSIVGLEFKSLDPSSPEKTYYHAIMIGKTGTYEVQLNDPIMGIYLLWLPPKAILKHKVVNGHVESYYVYEDSNELFSGKISYGYTDYFVDKTFDYIKSVQLSEEIFQITGLPINQYPTDSAEDHDKFAHFFTIDDQFPDAFEFYQMNNLACNLAYIHSLKFSRREIVDCYLIHGGNYIDGSIDNGIYKDAHLPYVFDSNNENWALQNRDEYFLCRTAMRYKEKDSDPAVWHVDGKTPLKVHEIDPQRVYKCNIINEQSGEFDYMYLDGRLLRFAMHAAYPNLYQNWDFQNYPIFDIGVEEWTAYDVFALPNKNWLYRCAITGIINDETDITDLFKIQLSAAGETDTIYFTPSEYTIKEQLIPTENETHYIYNYITNEAQEETVMTPKIYKHFSISEHLGSLIMRHQEIDNGFGLVIGPMIQLDGVVTVAQLTYDLSETQNSEVEAAKAQAKTIADQLANNYNSLSSSAQRYELYRAMQEYIFILSYYIAVLGVIDQPLMIPPLEWFEAMRDLDPTRAMEGSWEAIDEYATSDEIGLHIWNSNIIKPLPEDVEIDDLKPGIYYGTTNNDYTATVENYDAINGIKSCICQGNLVIVPPPYTMIKIMAQKDYHAQAIESARLSNIYNKRLANIKELPTESDSVISENTTYKVDSLQYTDDIVNVNLQKLLVKNNIVSIPANTVLDIRSEAQLTKTASITVSAKFKQVE